MAENKIAVITGVSRGLGLVTAQEFAAHGWQVVGTGRSERPAELATDVEYHQFDAGDAAACESFWQEVTQKYPEAEFCLVNNAGGYIGGSLAESSPEDYANQMQSIYFAAVYMTRGLVRAVPRARIINVISAGALTPHKNNSAYGAAKAAEMHFFQTLQKEFSPDTYQITNLYPDNIASKGPTPHAIDVHELAGLMRELADATASYYLPDITISARG